ATLTQVGRALRQTPAHIRHHLKALEQAGLVEATAGPRERSHLEKYYQAGARAWLVSLALLPETPAGQTSIFIGSQDLATQPLAEHFQGRRRGPTVQILPLNSLDGLLMLRQGVCQMATCHLKEPGADAYNRSYVQHLFPGQAMALIRLYAREGGLMVAPGNPKGLRGLADLARRDVRLVNREPGAGIRVWLDQSLAQLGLAPAAIAGYDAIAPSHLAVAQAIQAGRADAGIGLAAVAREQGLGFLPLFEEPYDLVLTQASLTDARYAPLFDYLGSGEYRAAVRAHAGYAVTSAAGRLSALNLTS
ncbi:MAG: substrate-binding domain-containing protein, partial [Anaerolineales bacterium]|nr:substrate-binding domain-containing protein [Anaerolineales bacterium]